MDPATASLTLLREQVTSLAVGTAFVVVGLGACAAAAIRRRSNVRVFAWLGVWSLLYGAQELGGNPAAVAALSSAVRPAVALVRVAISYLLFVAATLAWRELSRGGLRLLLGTNALAGLAVAVAGVGVFLAGGSPTALQPANTALAVFGLVVLVTVVAASRLAERYLVLPHRGVLAAGTLLFAGEALWANLSRPFGHAPPRVLSALGFAVLLFSFGYVALQAVQASERRLASIENELAVARRLQLSILPAAVPRLDAVRIAAAYEPMTAVAGDFYEFVAVDSTHAGLLVADVSGHGVPAALIASMFKVAVPTVASWASDPGELLRRLGALLHGHLRGQYVTAACLWLDCGTRTARYSAAGHPPLLHWSAAERTLARVESNGLLFGVASEADYPTREIAFAAGDRLLLYTDGLTECESASREAFGDARLEQVLRRCATRPAAEQVGLLLAAAAAWRPAAVPQQDDVTLLVVEALVSPPRVPGAAR
jgi:sigma-B regulation protein RsbU (phosphoserine phosphatase)